MRCLGTGLYKSIYLLAISVFILLPHNLGAEEFAWPAGKPIRFIVPTGAGGGTDTLARAVGMSLQDTLHTTFITEDMPGGAGIIGTVDVKQAAPDGLTLLFTQGAHTSNVAFFKHRYDPVTDFEPIAKLGNISFMICVNAKTGVKTMSDLLGFVKKKNGDAAYGSAGYATSGHLAMELLGSMTGLKMKHVPYQGTAKATLALLSNEVDVGVVTDFQIKQYVDSGEVRCVASTGSKRSPAFPDIPTVSEGAGLPGYAVEAWYGVLAPAKTRPSIITPMNREINRLVRDPGFVKQNMTPAGVTPDPMTPDQFKKQLEAEVQRFEKLAIDAHIEPQ